MFVKLSDRQILLLRCFGKSNYVKPKQKQKMELLKKLSKLSIKRINHYYANLDRPILSTVKDNQKRNSDGSFSVKLIKEISDIKYKKYDYSERFKNCNPIKDLIYYATQNVGQIQNGFTKNRDVGELEFGSLKYYEYQLPFLFFHSKNERRKKLNNCTNLKSVMTIQNWILAFQVFYDMATDYINSVDPNGDKKILQRFNYFYPNSECPPDRIFLNKYEEGTNSCANCHYDDTLFLSIIINVGEFDEYENTRGTLFICSDSAETKTSVAMPLKVHEGVIFPTHTFHKVTNDIDNEGKGRLKTRISLNIFY